MSKYYPPMRIENVSKATSPQSLRMLRTVIVEDNSAELENILTFLAQLCPNVEIVAVGSEVKEATELIVRTQPDLLITDVQLTGGTCYHLLEQLRLKNHLENLSIIFMTGYYDFNNATQAFKYAAVDFLVKPFSGKELQAAVEKVGKQQTPIHTLEQLSLLVELLHTPHLQTHRLAVTLLGGKIQMLELTEIMYLEAKGSMTNFHLRNLPLPIVANRNLGQYVDILQKDTRFFSISNSLLINLDYLQTYDHSEQAVKLKNYPLTLYASRQGGQRLRQHLITKNTISTDKVEAVKGFFRGLFGK